MSKNDLVEMNNKVGRYTFMVLSTGIVSSAIRAFFPWLPVRLPPLKLEKRGATEETSDRSINTLARKERW